MESPRDASELLRLASTILFGTLSATYRTCGKAECACHQDPAKRHGPYHHVSYRHGGRTRSYYVPAELRDQVAAGVAAWGRFQEIALDLAERNRTALGLGAKRKRTGRRR